ncbi:hypothetical protein [uncultured Aquimarina sp.]|uniref:hypothetical protein n=1 Tax=uncultured Aquimarina sp. TaxID=575652 RepID=UPI00262F60E1|nr:hypothetical protein [uncultured Aquimarina sp.]
MKRLFYVLPIIGLLLFASCNQDESDEIIDEYQELDESQIEITEITEGKNLVWAIPPGLYGPINTAPLTNVKYTYHPTQTQLNAIPASLRGYRIHFEVDNPFIAGTAWQHEASFDITSNSVTVKFPTKYNASTTRWRIRYEIYNKNTFTSYSRLKVVNVNFVIPG